MRLMRWVCLGLGVVILLAAFGIFGWTYWRGFHLLESIMWAFVGGLGVTSLVLLAIGIASKGERGKWASLSALATLLVAVSGLSVFSVGLFIAPFALFFLVVSLWKLGRSHA